MLAPRQLAGARILRANRGITGPSTAGQRVWAQQAASEENSLLQSGSKLSLLPLSGDWAFFKKCSGMDAAASS